MPPLSGRLGLSPWLLKKSFIIITIHSKLFYLVVFVFEIPENDIVLCGDLSDFAVMTQSYIYDPLTLWCAATRLLF